jgi:hypothetical protein
MFSKILQEAASRPHKLQNYISHAYLRVVTFLEDTRLVELSMLHLTVLFVSYVM